MKKLLTALIAFVPFTGMAASYDLDPAHTYANFTISHLGFSTTYGRLGGNIKGALELDMDKRTGSVEIVIDASTVDTGHQKRDDHLRSPDFLNVVEFPEITFKSTKVSFRGQDKATVEGNLTIKGVTKPVTLDVDPIKCGNHPFNKKEMCGFDATATIKRSDYGVNYGLPAIGDEMKLMFQMEAYKK